MGHLATHLRWFKAIAMKPTPDELVIPDIRWAHQNARQEAVSGGDFALIVDQSEYETAGSKLKIILFQAKAASSGPAFAIDHITHRSGRRRTKLQWTPNAEKLLFAIRDQIVGKFTAEHTNTIKSLLSVQMKYERYQLEALLRTHFRGQLLADQQRDWCYYSVWHTDSLPEAVSLKNVAASLYQGKSFALPKEHKIKGAYQFHEVLAGAFYENDSKGIQIKLNELPRFLERIEEITPQIDFLVMGRTIGPLLKGALKNTHSLSKPLVGTVNIQSWHHQKPTDYRSVALNDQKLEDEESADNTPEP
uniref:hypothetical protein n=1 Tax=Neorhizobium sp. EC2-8 TaxID=3129230 RepID=UPI003100F117